MTKRKTADIHPQQTDTTLSQQVSQAKQSAIHWLLHSGIQSRRGGVYAWHDARKKEYAFLYPEITGYAISLFLYLYQTERQSLFLDRAIQAGNWILSRAWDPQTRTISFRIYDRKSLAFPYAYTFDTGMVLSGLVQLATITGKKRYQNLATEMGEWLCRTMSRPEGGFFCFWDPKQNLRLISPDKWSTIPWGFLSKPARSLVELGKLTGNTLFTKTGEQVCEWTLRHQWEEGRFSVLADRSWVVSHPFLYTIEGLFLSSQLLQRKDFLESASKGLHWLFTQQLPDGGIPAEISEHREPYKIRSDVQAQFLRMALLIPEFGISRESILKTLQVLIEFQDSSKDRKARGGFRFAIDLEGLSVPHSNAWCTLFAIQALSLIEEWLEGKTTQETRQAAIRFFV